MTQVTMDDGTVANTDLAPEAVADLQTVEAPKEETPKAPEPTDKPAEVKAEEPKAETPKEPESQPVVTPRAKKASPIANLLATKHDLETELEASNKAIADLEAKVAELSKQPATTTDDIKTVAQKYNLDENALADIVAAARKGMPTSLVLPKEVQDLLKERENQKIIDAETQSFNTRLDGLAKTLNDEQLKDPKVRDKLFALAYSTEKAPDGEPYVQKELAELYFAFIKPEIEPGKPSAEPSRGGTQSQAKIIDFQEVHDRDNPKDIDDMDDETFSKYSSWLNKTAGLPPLKRGSRS